MKRVAIIQARMGSTRLPGKVLMDICGKTMLERVIDRVKACKEVDDILVATTALREDGPVIDCALGCGVRACRGSVLDVLGRYLGAARAIHADVVVRITADCPLLDPELVDTVICGLGDEDYCSNVIRRTYPKGLDAEAFPKDTLIRLNRMAKSDHAREHVTSFILREHPELFRCRSIQGSVDRSAERWTVDTQEDLERVRILCRAL